MKKYKHKMSDEIMTAVQWNKQGDCDSVLKLSDNMGFINLTDGGQVVNKGDWIIKRSNGEVYSCNNEEFKTKYVGL